MKLLRLKVEGFGALRGEFVFDPGRVAVLVDDNERGKSTLLAAVAAALYGLEDDKRTHRVLTPLDRWRPWDGGAYRVELEVESDGERLTITRDFERCTVAVWNARGQEVTAEFKEGKDAYPVGRRLSGLDADEFAKCALVGQNELDRVVPADEKVRRTSTLHARLENAADTRVGDTNATEALRVLDGAIRKYTCAEVESSGSVDTAIQRLETKREMLATDLKSLEHDQTRIAGPLEELVKIAEAERAARDSMHGLDRERRDSLAGDVRRQLAEDARHRAEVATLRAEAEALASSAHLPPNAETEFRETVARHEEAARNLGTLEARRSEEMAREREKREAELAGLGAYADATAEDADRAVALASELRQVADEDASMRTAVFTLRESLARQGHDPGRIQALTQRFGSRSDDEQRLLRKASQWALVYQTEVASLEEARTASTEVLREIDAVRHTWRMPGWFLVALGLASALAGGVVMALAGLPILWSLLMGGGVLLLVAGLVLLMVGGRARDGQRADALARLSDAQRRLGQLKAERAESEVDLADLARRMGFRDQVDLQREWGEYARLMEESAPTLRAHERLASLETRRKQAVTAATALLEPLGGAAPEPAELERVAQAIRQALAVRQRLAAIEAGWSWMDDERRVAEAAVAGLKERAVRTLQAAGLAYDPARPWADHARELSERAQAHARHALLTGELIPQAERRVLPEDQATELENQLALIEAERPETAPAPAAGTSGRSALEIEAENRRLRETLDGLQKRRTELRLEVEEIWRRYHQEHPEKTAQVLRIEQALMRARRFKAAVELARETIQSVATETHRRWAEFLNHRVTQLLAAFGTHVEQLRFGDDLDFSVKMEGGQQATRGRADLHLSAGAKDQLYLAVRLAVSEYLSRGQAPLPLLLDDPFATSDDERARAGMRLLIEHFAPLHQIIMLTCHRKRFESLAHADPALYKERVQWLDLGAASNVPR
jgi:ABC-type transport system involved in cytochrome c biogenesis ATPase subunit